MKLDIIEALRNGADRTIQKNGLMLAGLYFVVGLIATAASQTLFTEYSFLTANASGASASALALPVPGAFAVLLTLASSLASLVLSIVAIRIFVSDKTETIPSEFYSRNMPMTALNMIAGSISYGMIALIGALPLLLASGIFGLLSGIGNILALLAGLLILLGIAAAVSAVVIYAMVALYFWNIFVAAEDENFIDGLKNSWTLTDGSRLRLFALGIIITVATGVFSGLLGSPSIFGFNLAGTVLRQFGGAVTTVFTIATSAQAYNQLKTDDSGDPSFV